MNIILTGFASSGKSTTAAALAGLAGMRHADLDRVIEERYRQKRGSRLTCREIFSEAGSDGWDALEGDALRSLSSLRETVLSTGGRTPMLEENRALLKALGKIVYLRCGIDTVLGRMANKGYPRSMGGSAEGVAAEWERRGPVYSELADIIIDNDTLSPDETARVIMEKSGL